MEEARIVAGDIVLVEAGVANLNRRDVLAVGVATLHFGGGRLDADDVAAAAGFADGLAGDVFGDSLGRVSDEAVECFGGLAYFFGEPLVKVFELEGVIDFEDFRVGVGGFAETKFHFFFFFSEILFLFNNLNV